jgi:hypothetical protein
MALPFLKKPVGELPRPDWDQAKNSCEDYRLGVPEPEREVNAPFVRSRSARGCMGCPAANRCPWLSQVPSASADVSE